MNDIYLALNRMNEFIKGIKNMSDQIVDITKVSADNSQHVAASGEELSASMEEILSTSHILNNMAIELGDLVEKFKI
jgi:methyl-accepting chemotaxis protein